MRNGEGPCRVTTSTGRAAKPEHVAFRMHYLFMNPHRDLATVLHRHRLRRQWDALVRPSIRLAHAQDGDRVVGYLEGDPELPAGTPWPKDPEGDSLQLLLTVFLSEVPRIGLGLDLPERGRLLFMLDDDFRYPTVLFVADDTDLERCKLPDDLGPGPDDRLEVTALVDRTAPSHDHTYCRRLPERYFLDIDDPEIKDPDVPFAHRLGGYGEGVQYEPDFAPTGQAPSLEDLDLPGGVDPGVPELPVLLAQIDSDDETKLNWGDCGNSHWYIDREDLAARRFDLVKMAWSCY